VAIPGHGYVPEVASMMGIFRGIAGLRKKLASHDRWGTAQVDPSRRSTRGVASLNEFLLIWPADGIGRRRSARELR
jgi:hypothetical protein